MRHFSFKTDDFRAAFRAFYGHFKFRFLAGSFFRNNFDHLGDNISGTLNYHRVADTYVFFDDFILVVQCGAADHHAAHIYRFHYRHRCQCAHAPNLYNNVFDYCCFLLCGEFAGQRPARIARYIAEPILQGKAIHFNNYSIDIVGQRVSERSDTFKISDAGVDIVRLFN